VIKFNSLLEESEKRSLRSSSLLDELMLDTSNGTTDADLKSIVGTITSTIGTACSVIFLFGITLQASTCCCEDDSWMDLESSYLANMEIKIMATFFFIKYRAGIFSWEFN